MSRNVGPDCSNLPPMTPHADVSRLDVSWIGQNLPNFGLDFNNVGVDNTEAALDEETTEEVLKNPDDLD